MLGQVYAGILMPGIVSLSCECWHSGAWQCIPLLCKVSVNIPMLVQLGCWQFDAWHHVIVVELFAEVCDP